MKKIAFVLGGSGYNTSLYLATINTVSEMRKQGHTVDYIFWEMPGNELKDTDKCVNFFGLSTENKVSKLFYRFFKAIFGKHIYFYLFSFMFSSQMSKLKKKEGYCTVFYHGGNSFPFHSSIGNDYIVLHSAKYENLVKKHNGAKKKLYHLMYKRIYTAKNLLCVSKGVRNDLLTKIKAQPKSINVTYNGFDFKTLVKKSLTPVEIELPTDYIMAAGRPDRTKRFDILIKAYAKSQQVYPLAIFAEGRKLPELKELANNLGVSKNILFLDFTKNILPIIKQAKVFVLSSDIEGLPTVIIESFICNTPVVATNACGVDELLTNELETWIVDKGDIENLAKKMDLICKEAPTVSHENIAFLSSEQVALEYLKYC